MCLFLIIGSFSRSTLFHYIVIDFDPHVGLLRLRSPFFVMKTENPLQHQGSASAIQATTPSLFGEQPSGILTTPPMSGGVGKENRVMSIIPKGLFPLIVGRQGAFLMENA